MARQILNFFKSGSAGGSLLFLAAALATVIENSSWREAYHQFLEQKVAIGPEALNLNKTILHWIDDFLMVFFFLLVGLELKREWLEGELRSIKRVMLPALAAIGGMVAPALIFLIINWNHPGNHTGWAIPAATDIAFSLAILSVLGSRVPHSLKVFLTSLAIFDDLGAIIIIALFYSDTLAWIHLLGASGVLVMLFVLNRARIALLAPYIILGGFLWYFVLKSGIHATIAGVLMAMAIPSTSSEPGRSPLKKLEHLIHPWISFLVLPIFAFANGGLNLDSLSIQSLSDPLALGVLAGLFVGKQLGVFSIAYFAIRFRFAPQPTGSTFWGLYGVSIITGVGFTMSLFIGALAFDNIALIEVAKSGTIIGSLLSAVVGFFVLRIALKPR